MHIKSIITLIFLVMLFSCNDSSFDNGNQQIPTIIAQNDTTINVNDSIILTCVASDDQEVTRYSWIFKDTSIETVITFVTVAFDSVGSNQVAVSCYDNYDTQSTEDTFYVSVTADEPIIVPVRDTIVSRDDSVVVTVSAEDTNVGGTIVGYYWDTDKDGVWDDSGTVKKVGSIKNSGISIGGNHTFIWGAKDDDGMITSDTFSIIFNRPPSYAVFCKEVGRDWLLKWNAIDPDGGFDSLSYKVFVGFDDKKLNEVYVGRDTSYQMEILYDTTYNYSLTVYDTYGDSLQIDGNFTTGSRPVQKMVLIHAKDSSFIRGSETTTEFDRPSHNVSFTYDYFIDNTEITQKTYEDLMTKTYSGYIHSDFEFQGDNLPVSQINKYDAYLFCNARSKSLGLDTVFSYSSIKGVPGRDCTLESLKTDLTQNGFRLPSAAEWEYACRAGTTTDYYWGDGDYNNYEWCRHNSNRKLYEVASKLPNPWGLYDMGGNVSEWVMDTYVPYTSDALIDPIIIGKAYSSYRGGSVLSSSTDMTSVKHAGYAQWDSDLYTRGFRTVLPQKGQSVLVN